MKAAFLGLGVLCLLFYLIQARIRLVTVTCTLETFRVSVYKDLFGDGILVKPDELMLGFNCGVNGETLDMFELFYSVAECEIELESYETYVIYRVSFYYSPRSNLLGRSAFDIPLSCTVFRSKTPYLPKSDKHVPALPPQEDEEKDVRRMQPGPAERNQEVATFLKQRKRKVTFAEEIESWNWFYFTILTLSSIVSCFICCGDIGLFAS